jgi:hypothetical protein
MSWVITGRGVNKFLVMPLGVPTDGGFFAGLISHTADGSPTHALIVAPRATGASGTDYTLTTMLQWKTTQTTTAGTNSDFDGAANTSAMVTAGISDHPAAEFCVNLAINGFNDWYLPARYELSIAYFNLKPTTLSNTTARGENPYSVPRRNNNYTALVPSQTAILSFTANQEQAFVDGNHWSSTQISSSNAWGILFSNGDETSSVIGGITSSRRVRAFRRIAL